MLTVLEAADELKCSPNTVRAMCKAGRLPSIRIGNRYRIDLDRAWAEKEQKKQARPIVRRPDEVKRIRSNNDYLAAIAALKKLERRDIK